MCFSLEWMKNFLIWLVVLCFVVACLKLLLPVLLSWLGWAGDLAIKIINYAIAAIVIIALIIFIFSLAQCLLGGHALIR